MTTETVFCPMSIVHSASLSGVEAFGVDISVELSPGNDYHVVGLPLNAVKESMVRVRAALAHSGYKLEPRKVTIAVAPLDVRKDSAAFDLPIAVGILAAHGQIHPDHLRGVMLLGELSLDGTLRRVKGALPVALHARSLGMRTLILPADCANEAAVVADSMIRVLRASTLAGVVDHLTVNPNLSEVTFKASPPRYGADQDLCQVKGLEVAKRALEVAAAGGHNILLIGSRGSGKGMLARCLPGILPTMTESEAIETSAIYSAAGKLEGASLVCDRPYRAPHHDVSVAGLVGGGVMPFPGEVTLAHHGVLFLDEIPEFRRSSLEALRQPLTDRRITIVRKDATLSYPASFMLVGAMNPCPCGNRGSALRPCTCSEERVKRYWGRLSGPLFDRFDLHVEIGEADYRTLQSGRVGESSASVRDRVVAARTASRKRLAGTGKGSNAEMSVKEVRDDCQLDPASDRHLESCVKRFALSGRSIHRILKVARTCADLGGREKISSADVAEAIAYRKTFDGELS